MTKPSKPSRPPGVRKFDPFAMRQEKRHASPPIDLKTLLADTKSIPLLAPLPVEP